MTYPRHEKISTINDLLNVSLNYTVNKLCSLWGYNSNGDSSDSNKDRIHYYLTNLHLSLLVATDRFEPWPLLLERDF
jgi:hypothetical protein